MQLRRFLVVSSLVLVAAACASSKRPANVAMAEVNVRPLATPFFGSGQQAPVALEVHVTNKATVPVNVRKIRISSPDVLQFSIRSEERVFGDTLAPGATKAFTVSTMASATSTPATPLSPVTLRVVVEFEAAGTSYREVYTFPNTYL
jgi:hypothetical protein